MMAYVTKYLLRSSRLRRSFYTLIKRKDIFVHARIDISNLNIILNIGDYIQYWIFMEGGYERDICHFISQNIKNRIFIDIGANIGCYGLSLCKYADHIYAFEASESSCKMFQKNVEMNFLKNVTIINRAVYDTNGNRVYLRHSNDASGNNSLFINEGNIIEEVETITIDEYVNKEGINNVGVIKIDIEGSELYAIKGAKNTIKKYRPIIICELNSLTCKQAGYDVNELYSYIVSFGYNGFYIKKGKMLSFEDKRLSEREFYENIIFICKN
jgi:FkbM family methyltransferase